MQNPIHILSITLSSLLFVSCANNTSSHSNGIYSAPPTTRNPNATFDDTTYMRTGLYFLAADDAFARKMMTDSLTYYIEKTPFLSVDNIVKAEIINTLINGANYQDLMLTFDAKGAQDLKEGTSSMMHSQIAVVIVGKLITVPNIESTITGRSLSIAMNNYTVQELQEIIHKIEQKL